MTRRAEAGVPRPACRRRRLTTQPGYDVLRQKIGVLYTSLFPRSEVGHEIRFPSPACRNAGG